MEDKKLLLEFATILGYSQGIIKGIQTWENLTEEQQEILNNNLNDFKEKQEWFESYIEKTIK